MPTQAVREFVLVFQEHFAAFAIPIVRLRGVELRAATGRLPRRHEITRCPDMRPTRSRAYR